MRRETSSFHCALSLISLFAVSSSFRREAISIILLPILLLSLWGTAREPAFHPPPHLAFSRQMLMRANLRERERESPHLVETTPLEGRRQSTYQKGVVALADSPEGRKSFGRRKGNVKSGPLHEKTILLAPLLLSARPLEPNLLQVAPTSRQARIGTKANAGAHARTIRRQQFAAKVGRFSSLLLLSRTRSIFTPNGPFCLHAGCVVECETASPPPLSGRARWRGSFGVLRSLRARVGREGSVETSSRSSSRGRAKQASTQYASRTTLNPDCLVRRASKYGLSPVRARKNAALAGPCLSVIGRLHAERRRAEGRKSFSWDTGEEEDDDENLGMRLDALGGWKRNENAISSRA